jgi:hypothetical protein
MIAGPPTQVLSMKSDTIYWVGADHQGTGTELDRLAACARLSVHHLSAGQHELRPRACVCVCVCVVYTFQPPARMWTAGPCYIMLQQLHGK